MITGDAEMMLEVQRKSKELSVFLELTYSRPSVAMVALLVECRRLARSFQMAGIDMTAILTVLGEDLEDTADVS